MIAPGEGLSLTGKKKKYFVASGIGGGREEGQNYVRDEQLV